MKMLKTLIERILAKNLTAQERTWSVILKKNVEMLGNVLILALVILLILLALAVIGYLLLVMTPSLQLLLTGLQKAGSINFSFIKIENLQLIKVY